MTGHAVERQRTVVAKPAAARRGRRRRREVESEEFIAFCRRIVRAMGRRAVVADPEDFAMLAGLADDLNKVVADAAAGLYDAGYSWAEIGASLNITRQAARQRWGITDRRTA